MTTPAGRRAAETVEVEVKGMEGSLADGAAD